MQRSMFPALAVPVFVVGTMLLTSCGSKQATRQEVPDDIPAPYRQSVRAGRLSPEAARSLRGSAPTVERMDAFVDRVEKARTRINRLDIPEAEKRRRIKIEMKAAAREWQQKASEVRR